MKRVTLKDGRTGRVVVMSSSIAIINLDGFEEEKAKVAVFDEENVDHFNEVPWLIKVSLSKIQEEL